MHFYEFSPARRWVQPAHEDVLSANEFQRAGRDGIGGIRDLCAETPGFGTAVRRGRSSLRSGPGGVRPRRAIGSGAGASWVHNFHQTGCYTATLNHAEMTPGPFPTGCRRRGQLHRRAARTQGGREKPC